MDVSQLEPADRDPVKLRRTALLLVLFTVVGGFAILFAYNKYGERAAESGRPRFESKITDDCRMVTADGEVRDIQDLKGKVTLALSIASDSAELSKDSLETLRVVMDHFKEAEEKPQVLVFVLDGSEESPEGMKGVLEEFGGEPEVWRVAASEDGKVSVRAFSKNRMRFGIYPEKRDGAWKYDNKLVLLDQHLQIRGIPNIREEWDFEVVAKMEAEYEKAKVENPEEELKPLPMTTEKLRGVLIESIEYLYANPDEKGQK